MIGHLTKSVNTMIVFFHPFLQEKIKARPVAFCIKNILATVASQDDMVNSARIMNAWFSCHIL